MGEDHPAAGVRAARIRLDWASVEALILASPPCTIDSVTAAVERGDYEEAAARALARVAVGLTLPSDVAAWVIPAVPSLAHFLGLIGISTGDRAEALVEVLDHLGFPSPMPTAMAAYAAWRLGEPERIAPRLMPYLRRLARARLNAETGGVVAQLVTEIGDPWLIECAAMGSREPGPWTGVATLDRMLAATPEQMATELRVRQPPAYEGPDAELTPAVVRTLLVSDLVHVELDALGDEALVAAIQRFLGFRRWDLAESVVDRLARRASVGVAADHYRAEVAAAAFCEGHFELACEVYGRFEDQTGVPVLIAAAMRGDGIASSEVVRQMSAAHHDDSGLRAESMACTLAQTMPELALFVARGCFASIRDDAFLEVIERIRDDLGLPPGDPAREVRAAFDRVECLEAESEDLRARVEAAAAEVRELGAARDEVVAELQALRGKNDRLKEIIREGNEERRELRRQLALTRSDDGMRGRGEEGREARSGEARDAEASTGDELFAEPVTTEPTRGIRAPVFTRAAADALQTVPAHVAAAALRTVAALAGGDEAAWRGIKQAKDMAQPVLMARVGLHYRVLVSLAGEVLEVLDLVSREDLLARLKRMRAR